MNEQISGNLKCALVLLSAAGEPKSWNPLLLDVLEIYIIHGNPWQVMGGPKGGAERRVM